MDCGFLAMLWRIWMLLVSFLRRMTVRPNVLLPMAVKGSGTERKCEIGAGNAGTSPWKEHKAEFLRNPSLRKSKQEQNPRRRFFDFGSRPRQANTISSNSSQQPGNANGDGDGYGKWRKKQSKTNAFVFVTPPTVTIQDWSSIPLTGTPINPAVGTAAIQDSKPPPRPPRPPSGPVPAVIITPCTPVILPGAKGGVGHDGPGPRSNGFQAIVDRDHHRSGSGRHLSPDWFVRSATTSTSGGHGHGRKGSVQIPKGAGGGGAHEPNKPTTGGRDTSPQNVPETPFKNPPAIFPSSQFPTSTSISASNVQYHQDITLPWSDDGSNSSSNPCSLPERLNSRAASYITSTPAKNAKGMGGVPFPDLEEGRQDASFHSSVSEAGSSPPHSQSQARRIHLPDDQLDLLPYPEVFDLDIYFRRGRDRLPMSSQRLSLCVLRNAKIEDIQQMQELQSRQSESLSIKDLMMLYEFSQEFSSPPPHLRWGGGVGRDEDKENLVPAPLRSGKVKRLGHVSEDQGARPSHTTHTRSVSTVDSGSVGGVMQEAERAGYRPQPLASRPILRQVENTTTTAPATHKRSISAVSVANGVSVTQEAERNVYGYRPPQSQPQQRVGGRPALRQIENTMAMDTSATVNVTMKASSATSRVLVPPSSSSQSHSHLRSHQPRSGENHHPPQLQIRIPGLSERVINHTKEKDLSPIKEAFHPPSSSVPPPPVPPSTVSTPLNPITSTTIKTTTFALESQCPRRRPPTIPIVIVSHHRFGSISDYGDGDGTVEDYKDEDALYYDPESSEDEKMEEDEARYSKGFKYRLPGRGPGYERKERRKRRGSRWPYSSSAYGDEESGLEVVSLD